MAFGDELLEAFAAFKRTFASMGAHVGLEVTSLSELLEAFSEGT
jgi:hypothetical protein